MRFGIRDTWTYASTISILAFAIFVPSVTRAQNATGALRGVVQDASTGRVTSAKIVIQSLVTSFQRQMAADDRGEFRVDDLLPGTYRIIVNAPGLAEVRSALTVIISSVRDVTITMEPESAHQTVRVQEQASSITTQAIDLATAIQQGAVSAQDLQTIPLAHRSFANVAYLVPGTEPVEPSDPTKARITAVSFGGSSGLNVRLSVDGGDNSDDYIGGFLQNYSPEAIQEFVVRTAQESADTGRTTGGSVVITTKRGSDQWHMDSAFYERAAALNARLPIDNPPPEAKQPFSRQNYLGALGGPVKKDKIWFFSSIEYVHEDASIAYSPSSLTQFDALGSLAARGLIPGVSSIAVPDVVPVPFHDMLLATRLDWSQSAHSQWYLRAAADRYTTQNDLVQQATLSSTGATSRSHYMNLLLSEHYAFSPSWLGSFTLEGSGLRHSETRNAQLGFALAFPFSSTYQTISGYETFGDNQFVTPITAFPVSRSQQKYQLRYDVSHSTGQHATSFGVDFIHEPVLSGRLASTAETLIAYPNNPSLYTNNSSQFYFNVQCAPPVPIGVTCTHSSAGDGSFDQGLQRLGFYAEDSWRVTQRFTFSYGVRYDTTFGLFEASGRDQLQNDAYLTLKALGISLISGAPHDYRRAIAPRLGIAYSPGHSLNTVIRVGFGLFYGDLAQVGWVTAFQAVNTPLTAPCTRPGDPGCIPGAAFGGSGSVIDPQYKTPYAVHATAGIEHAFNSNWLASAEYTHEQGVHAYRRYQYQAAHTLFTPLFPLTDMADQLTYVPNISDFRSDNRSSYNALSVHLQGNLSHRFSLTANYTLANAKTWGCVLGELFDYVNGVCDPLNAFKRSDFGPSGEDVRHRFVLAGTVHLPRGFELTALSQAESARPFTITTPVDVNGLGDSINDRAVVNGIQTSLDEFRGTPYIQIDMRLSRPFKFYERWTVVPFVEFFNLFNRNNPGANYVTNLAALPTPVNNLNNATALCMNPPVCSVMQPISSLNQLRVPAGAVGDFFGPGTTVGIPFAAQVGFRMTL